MAISASSDLPWQSAAMFCLLLIAASAQVPAAWTRHEGHPGWRFDQISAILKRSLATSVRESARAKPTTRANRLARRLPLHGKSQIDSVQVFNRISWYRNDRRWWRGGVDLFRFVSMPRISA